MRIGTAVRAGILALSLLLRAGAGRPQHAPRPKLSDEQLITEIERRACLFFVEKADPSTGLVYDRAHNDGRDANHVASTASTGYGLVALAVAAEHGWIARDDAVRRAERALSFAFERMTQEHGWLYHFVDRGTGRRVWSSEVSTIDTCLLVCGALVAGEHFGGKTLRLANALYDRLDWTWARTNGGRQPAKTLVSMGWKPESGFLASDWDSYNEGILIYLLGMGARRNPLPPSAYTSWPRPLYRYGGFTILAGGPIFLNQMPHGFFDFHGRRDALGWNYAVSAASAPPLFRRFCMDRADRRKGYGSDTWALNACDGPKGYAAYGIPGPEDGTLCPTGAVASLPFAPGTCLAAARAMYERYGARIWGRYGFSDSFNVDAGWYDSDVIGIDLGMALIAVENHRTGLVWRLFMRHPAVQRGMAAAGFHRTNGQPGAGAGPLRAGAADGKEDAARLAY